jgi:hypothetical protein
MSAIPDVPPSLRAVAHYIKIANEYASRDVVIYYWSMVLFLGFISGVARPSKRGEGGGSAVGQKNSKI